METNGSTVAIHHAARQLLDVVPGVMKEIRQYMRSHQKGDLTVVQFRSLCFLDAFPGASLSDAADYIGLSLPAMSKLIDGMLERGLVRRKSHTTDRRRIVLTPTERGQKILAQSRAATRTHLAEQISEFSARDLVTIATAMEVLRPVFLGDVDFDRLPAAPAKKRQKH